MKIGTILASAGLALALLIAPRAVAAPSSPAPTASPAAASLHLEGTLRTWDGPRFKVRVEKNGVIYTFTKAPDIQVQKGVKPGSTVRVLYEDKGNNLLLAHKVAAPQK